ncbi:SDR family oxidoreductase [Aeromonas schubertii]|uniref:Short-chain dehydrogenase n=2 Tax=Aeromonas TaxID=642 RepID=A0A0S2SMC6_9GAMM|nr:SDR family NAD(P)-dependent oxidoreductase [Aeromonas schubertii]ALP42890.1 short-chain dehydrogenase [Aeromonas schubertii]KUE78144.1 short-chain dehydrogenase [Aeromonas schubertii]MBZ6073825.1 SDR family NAD(P)-dependent oxidoreductase [Aeromonas schubertii]QCG49555.1 SDR family NAD(P)-dependent oxidoreductase [Aeromonas schubertii]
MKKIALITGASRGIGRALAVYFADQGYDLLLVARSADQLASCRQALQASHEGIVIETLATDFASPDVALREVEALLARHTRLDVLVSSAGVLNAGHVEMDLAQLGTMVNINLITTMAICNLVARKMKTQGRGEIYNIGSMAGLEPVGKIGAYAATKAAIVSYSQSLYQELLPHGVRVCCLCPSVVDTDMTNDGRIPNELKIATGDLVKAVAFVRSLSAGCAMATLPIRCRVIDQEKG